MDTSYLTTQVSTIIGQLHGIFDEIGVPNHEREARESEVGERFIWVYEWLSCNTDVTISFLQRCQRRYIVIFV
jgi:hypothetical protein